jgi:hypothetical protein
MSTELERELDNYLFFGGDMPNLAEGVREVPMPTGVLYCRVHNKVNCDLDDPDPFKDYTDGGDYESSEKDAQL